MGWDRFQIGGGLKQRQTWQIATVAKKQEDRNPAQTFSSLKDTLPYMPDIPAG